MPISLNSIQQTLNTSHIDADSYIKLSNDRSGIESYNAGFFGRHFHIHATRSDNREVRRAFYESITSQYKCSDAFCASLRQELGIDSGNHSALSVRDAQAILQRVKIAARDINNTDVINNPIQNGQPFTRTSNGVFKEVFLDAYNKGCLKRADDAKKYPTIADAFKQPYCDYNRPGFGLKVGNTVVAYVDDSTENGSDERATFEQEMTAKLEQFFGQDPTNGLRAARIIGDIVHQSIDKDIVDGLISSKDPVLWCFNDGNNNPIGMAPHNSHMANFSVDRANDGSYNIHINSSNIPNYLIGSQSTTFFDGKNSQITFNLDLVLSFDPKDGTPKIDLPQPLQMSGKLTKMTTPDDIVVNDMSILARMGSDPKDNTQFGIAAAMTGVINDPAVQQALFKTHDVDFIRSKVITDSDIKMLGIFNIDEAEVRRMTFGLGLGDNAQTLDKETINQLLSSNPAERGKGIQKLKNILTTYDALGWAPQNRQSNIRCYLRPELLNLVTVAELNHSSGIPCDAKLVADYMRTSNDPDHQRILNDLGSSDPTKVAAAKNDVKAILAMLRNPSAPAPTAADVQQPINQTTTTTTTTTTTITEGSDSEQPSTPASQPPITPQPDVNQTTTTTTITEGSEPEQPTPPPPPPVTPQPNIQPTTDAKPEQPPTASAPPPPTVEP